MNRHRPQDPRRPSWEREGRDWPNRSSSHFVQAAGLRWHVQTMGEGEPLLLVHGTGAATHSWRDLAPLLAKRFRVIAPDLPGHGFTETPAPERLSLPGIADAVGTLLRKLGATPQVVVGHSAGAAILARMCLDGTLAPRALVSLNGALMPWRGLPGHLFSPMARFFAASTLVPRLFAWRAHDRTAVERLVRSTGSTIDAHGFEWYARLVRNPVHVAGALTMMANWDLRPLVRDLPRLRTPLTLVVGERDSTVPPEEAQRVQSLVPAAAVVALSGLGHLAHEERPEEVAALILKCGARAGRRRTG